MNICERMKVQSKWYFENTKLTGFHFSSVNHIPGNHSNITAQGRDRKSNIISQKRKWHKQSFSRQLNQTLFDWWEILGRRDAWGNKVIQISFDLILH